MMSNYLESWGMLWEQAYHMITATLELSVTEHSSTASAEHSVVTAGSCVHCVTHTDALAAPAIRNDL